MNIITWILAKLFPPRLPKLELDDWSAGGEQPEPEIKPCCSEPRFQNGIERTRKGKGAEDL